MAKYQFLPGRVLLAIAVPALALTAVAQEPAQPDNTKVNERDKAATSVTADDQKMNSGDTEMTKKIRQSVMADSSLSTYAHNVKIVTRGGVVTLKGPVRSDDERKAVVSKAVEVAGSADKVKDELSVKPKS